MWLLGFCCSSSADDFGFVLKRQGFFGGTQCICHHGHGIHMSALQVHGSPIRQLERALDLPTRRCKGCRVQQSPGHARGACTPACLSALATSDTPPCRTPVRTDSLEASHMAVQIKEGEPSRRVCCASLWLPLPATPAPRSREYTQSSSSAWAATCKQSSSSAWTATCKTCACKSPHSLPVPTARRRPPHLRCAAPRRRPWPGCARGARPAPAPPAPPRPASPPRPAPAWV